MPYQSSAPQSTEWETPQALFDLLDAHFHFDLDVCALPTNAKCAQFFSPEEDGQRQSWQGACWMNPPYGRPIAAWVKKANAERHRCRAIVCLLPARTDTRWFHEHVLGKVTLVFLRGRLRLLRGGIELQGATFPSMLAIYTPGAPETTVAFLEKLVPKT